MNQSFAVALDRPAEARNFEIFAGDEFALKISVYATDAPDAITPLDLTGQTLSLRLSPFGWPYSSIDGVVGDDGATFIFTDVASKCRGGRIPYSITLDNGTFTRVIAFGVITVDRVGCWPPPGWLYDYGWVWPLW